MSSGPERPAYDHRDEPVWTSRGPDAPIQPWELRRNIHLPPELRPRRRYRDVLRDQGMKRAVMSAHLIETK